MEKKKNGKWKKILLGFGILLVALIAFFAYLVVEDLKQEDLLKQEIVNLSNKDLTKDDFSIEVKTTGDYAYVEEAIKKYYKELSNNVKKLSQSLNNQEFIEILSPNTLAKERPNFTNSYKILEEARTSSVDSMNKIANLCEEKTIQSLIDKEKVDDYYYDLFIELMYTKEDLKEFQKLKEAMLTLSNDTNAFLEKIKEILDFLKANNSTWEISDNQIYFSTNELVDQYNTLYQDLIRLSDKISKEADSTNTKEESNGSSSQV